MVFHLENRQSSLESPPFLEDEKMSRDINLPDSTSSDNTRERSAHLQDTTGEKTQPPQASTADEATEIPTSNEEETPVYPQSWRFAIMMISAGSAAFLVGYVSDLSLARRASGIACLAEKKN